MNWRFTAPVGPIELEEIRWYLEKYAIWPNEIFKDRARKVERSLNEWGRLLYNAAFPRAHVSNVREARARIPAEARRRFSVLVKIKAEAGASSKRLEGAREAARAALVELMAAMERQFPGSREHSLFASVELSLRRMSPKNWNQLPPADSGVDLAGHPHTHP